MSASTAHRIISPPCPEDDGHIVVRHAVVHQGRHQHGDDHFKDTFNKDKPHRRQQVFAVGLAVTKNHAQVLHRRPPLGRYAEGMATMGRLQSPGPRQLGQSLLTELLLVLLRQLARHNGPKHQNAAAQLGGGQRLAQNQPTGQGAEHTLQAHGKAGNRRIHTPSGRRSAACRPRRWT